MEKALDTLNMENTLKPVFAENAAVITFASDDRYIAYTATAIQSLIVHASKDKFYDIIILEDGVTLENKEKTLSLTKHLPHISIRFFNMDAFYAQYDASIFHVHSHFSRAVYNRLFAEKIFACYKKVLYLDSDIIILDDIEKLFAEEIGNTYFGKIPNPKTNRAPIFEYIKMLNLENPHRYYGSNLLLFNIEAITKDNFTEKCLSSLKKIGTPFTVDQDALNLAYQDNLYDISWEWDYAATVEELYEPFDYYRDDFLTQLEHIKLYPKILHYPCEWKPWLANDKYIPKAKYFWIYLSQTPFFEEVMDAYIQDTSNKLKACAPPTPLPRIVSLFYKIIKKLSFGKIR